MVYSGFVLQLFAALAVAAVFVLRRKNKTKSGFRSPFFPIPQIIFLMLSAWVLIYLVIAQPMETGLGLLNLVLGLMAYKLDVNFGKKGQGS